MASERPHVANQRVGPVFQVRSNPVNYTDPTGLHFWTDIVGGVIGGGSAIGCSIGTALLGTIVCGAAGMYSG